ncbi:MAG: T9SS type A sorting domain-containing protein, partial [Bacteroidia bacterium]|nr:T9SS type A sorting domain-containing protein [Bacteroidia bacterium]
TDVDDILSSQSRFKAWYSEGTITISGEITGEGEITVYDVQGRKLAVEKPGYSNLNRIEVPQATSGIYLIKVKDSNSSEVLKIVQTGN